jgi:hypothetical protein
VAADVPSLDLALKISDLGDGSQLNILLQDRAQPLFKFAAAIAPYWSGPVEKVPAGTKAAFSLSEGASWMTSTGITFGLSGSAECDLEVLTKGSAIEYLDNLDATSPTGLPAGDYSGSVYVKLSLSFDISGGVSGAGSVGPLGIRGNAKGSVGASFGFAHKVKCGTLLKDAISESFRKFVFPFEPSCATDMAAGDIAQVTFSGSMSYGLQVSYGIANYNFTAPSVTTVLESCTKGVASLNLPSASIDISASASLDCSHSDDFTAIVQKLDDGHAFLYLMRARKTELSGGVRVGAQIMINATPSLTLSQPMLQDAVDHISQGKAGTIGLAVSGNLQNKLNEKLNSFVQNGAGLEAKFDRQASATMILKYKVALANPAVLHHSWNYFCLGDIRSAVGAGGLVLEPGSGISKEINRSLSISVTFFNFFHAQNVSSYFQKSQTVVTDTGDIRFLFDVGEESDAMVNKALRKARIHFVADAIASKAAEVKLEIELSETNDRKEAGHMIAIPGYLVASAQASGAANDMQQFVAANPAGTLNLNFVLESSAYGKLTCSPYIGKKPPVDQSVDARNWKVFHDAAVSLLDLDYAAGVTYSTWQAWNEAANGATVADRRHIGDPAAGAVVWPGKRSDEQLKLGYFCGATASFMNLCDDLQQLAERVSTAKIPDDWNRLLGDLKDIVTHDVNTDFAKPAVAALLRLCPAKQVSYDKQVCGPALSWTISLM